MTKANYIIFHPDNARQQEHVQAVAMVQGQVVDNWNGNVWVDRIGHGNEDPFVFFDPWLYSYCHATQLRRKIRKDNNYLQVASKIIFVSGQAADEGILTIDTVFLIGGVQSWTRKKSLQLPLKYQPYFQVSNSTIWNRHFRFPFIINPITNRGTHDTVSHTYEAELWQEDKADYSFLPLDKDNKKVSISLDTFPEEIKTKIANGVKGKYPVSLSDNEMNLIAIEIENRATIKVLKNIVSRVLRH
jgi:hypothetical protein